MQNARGARQTQIGADGFNQSLSHATHLDVLEAHGECKVVVVVAHGLNLRAHALRELYEPLRERGACIVVLRLRGHARDSLGDASIMEEWRTLDTTAWLEDWREAVEVAQAAATTQKVDLAFLGYSLGALVHTYGLANSETPPPFRRQVLLAPALRVRKHTRLVLLFRPLGRRFLVPSITPTDIRSHGATSVAAYDSLLGYEGALSVLEDPTRLKIPTLILMDPGDELVSQKRLLDWIERNGLKPEWRLVPLAKDFSTAKSSIRHHIINQHGLGKSAFDALVKLLSDALIDKNMSLTAGAEPNA